MVDIGVIVMEGSIEARLGVSYSKEWDNLNVKAIFITSFFEDVRFVVYRDLLEIMNNNVCMSMPRLRL
jgi:hypothetical protein